MLITPWGFAYREDIIGDGILFCVASGGAGFHVSEALNVFIPESLRNEDGWYDADREGLIVAAVFPECFGPDMPQVGAAMLVADFFPAEFVDCGGVLPAATCC